MKRTFMCKAIATWRQSRKSATRVANDLDREEKIRLGRRIELEKILQADNI